MCSICACGTEDEDYTTLECGHTFHVACVLQWFRYEHTTCPNCRSSETHQVWARRSPAERVAAMKRRKNVPHATRRKLNSLNKTKEKWMATSRERKDLQKTYNAVFQKYNKLSTQEHHQRCKYYDMIRTLARTCVPNVPFMVYEGNESETDASFE